MSDAFADTAYWIALLNVRDEYHSKAMSLARGYVRFVTTQWILVELLDGFCGEATRQGALDFVRILERQSNLVIVEANSAWLKRGMDFYSQRKDKAWSLTDCVSIEVMNEYGLMQALTADHHFEQAGFVALLK